MNTSMHPDLPLLIVDDESQTLDSFEIVLISGKINHFIRCQDSREVQSILSAHEVEAVLLDLKMPHITGDELLSVIITDYPAIPVIVITGADDVETAVKCMKAGAFDYMVKPVERSRLLAGVKRAIEIRELQRENLLLKAQVLSPELIHPEAFSEIISKNNTMISIFRYTEAISASPQPVLITGETGTGKELIAKSLHTLSNRKGEFVAVNVAGLDDNVFTDTLFGHKKGAFTGADQPRSGLIEKASEGTLFLDEIGDLTVASQVKLLRLLQENEFLPLGSDVTKRSSARVIFSTNQDLQVQLTSDRFRKDLYYRLSTHHIHIPPLRDRKEDLPLLLDYFLEQCSDKLGKKKPTPPKELLVMLQGYSFPGNIRELQSMIFDAVSSHRSGILSMEIFRPNISQKQPAIFPSPMISFHDQLPTLKEIEELLVTEAMRRAGNNQSIAAMSLGISRQALNKRLAKMRQ
ncbi:MAG TPA: sigma-54 dependent transcriptional regulator [Desulfatiglandales bacterium]|nr:sigma-54 dependent transcriptional regulator [Desulfatiglandales bacterium]